MKRRIENRSRATAGPRVWAGIEELSDDPRFQAFIEAEYPAALELPTTARRQFLKLMGASFALAGLTGCEKSSFVAALPYVDQPESETIGLPRYYATAVLLDGYAQPVIATIHAGRPTKLDGNPEHPVTRGRSDVFMQSAVLQLYDPDRAAAPSRHGEPASWADVESAIGTMRENWRANQGDGMRLLLGPTTSPTLLRQIDAFKKQFPKARTHIHTTTGLETRRQITTAVYGQAVDLHYQLANCDVVVGFDEDFLGSGPNQVRNALGWSLARRRFGDRPGNRLFMAESVPSPTGALANQRLIADTRRMPALAEALASTFGVAGASRPELTEVEAGWIARVADACKEKTGRSLFVSGLSGGVTTAFWTARINQQLGNGGETLKLTVSLPGPAGSGTLAALVSDINAGRVTSLIVLDCNPVYTGPGELELGAAITRVRSSLHIGLQRDETGEKCEWQLPLAHALESWSDARAVDGTATILQPVISPFYDVRTAHQIFAMLLGETDPSSDAAVRETWQQNFGDAFDLRWKQALHDGFVEGAAPFVTMPPVADAIMPASVAGDLDIVFQPDPTIWDGRFANVGWLQELPKTLTTVTWSNVIAVSPALAKRLAATNGDHAEVTVGRRRINGPLWVMPGQADNTIALYLGYGRTRAGRVGDGLGYDAYQVRLGAEPWLTQGSLRKLDTREDLPVTQLHHRMEGFDFAREVSPGEVKQASRHSSAGQPSLYATWPSSKNAWGMVIDLDSCIGCNACVAACTAENNVPVVGADQVRAGREMHWLRIARYYTGDIAEPHSFFEPVPCMHCEDAPCEMGCPVHATTHSPEGVNQMVYNRCIGTRTCSSYCPYKVRRFNFYDYRAPADSPTHAVHNPDVTVRSRGVMEKCTYCTQRIEAAHVAADKENRPIRDGEVVTACQQACPTKAIVFGDINDPNSEVARLKRDGRHYVLLEEQGTRPRTTYLARWREDDGIEARMSEQSEILPTRQSMGGVADQLTGIPLHFPAERRWLIAMLFASALLLLLLVSAVELFTRGVGIWGINIPVNWAFAIHNYVWWLGIGHAGTLISALLLLTGSEWRNSLNRFAETMTLFAVVCAGIYPLLHLGRPWYVYWMFPYPATMGVWPQFRSPLEWDIWAVMTYLIVSLAFWYTGLIPDLAAARDRATRRGWQVFFGITALGWRGSAKHWSRWSQTYRLMAGLAVPLVVSVHSEVSLLFAAGQIPGWHSTIFPPYFVLGAAFSGFAVVSIIAVTLRSWFGLENLVTDDHLNLLGKVLLATGLMTAYGYVFEVFDVFYSGDEHELQTLADRFTGAYAWTYWGAVIFNFIPLQALWWQTVRRTGWVLLLISVSVAVGMWLERYMILVSSLYRDFLVSSWSHFTPTFWDWSTYFGTIGLFLVPFLIAIRVIPMISIFETKELLHEEQEEQHG